MDSMTPQRDLDAQVSAYLRHLIQQERAKGTTWDALAEKIGVTRPQLINVSDDDRGAGTKTLRGFAAAYHGGSMDALEAAAVEHAKSHTAPPPSRRGEPYPNRALVMATPEYKAASDDVKEAFRTLRGADGGADKSVFAWSVALNNLIERERLGMLETGRGRPLKSTRK